MGVSINPISITNANDSLHRIISNNDWKKNDAVETLAPAMNMTVRRFFHKTYRFRRQIDKHNSKIRKKQCY